MHNIQWSQESVDRVEKKRQRWVALVRYKIFHNRQALLEARLKSQIRDHLELFDRWNPGVVDQKWR
jgi:hypothetical protein